MAEVYCADDVQLGRRVAVKLLHERFAPDEEFVERFRREASSAASLSHANIVSVYDRGEWGGTYYIAMEYLDGRSLDSIVREEAPLPPDRAIEITEQVLRAARFAHRRGVVHRDLKPHNVIVDEEGRVKVTDFGIARAGASEITQTGSIMGTARYLSPEQAQGHPVSPRSDLYSIGVMLYELLTGTVPFEGDSVVAIALRHLSEPPRPPSSLVPSISPSLDAIVLRALAKNPEQRFADADEFLAALDGRARADARRPDLPDRGAGARGAAGGDGLPVRADRARASGDLHDAGDRADHRGARPQRRGVVGARPAPASPARLGRAPAGSPPRAPARGLALGRARPPGARRRRGRRGAARQPLSASTRPRRRPFRRCCGETKTTALADLGAAGYIASSRSSPRTRRGHGDQPEPDRRPGPQGGTIVTLRVSGGPGRGAGADRRRRRRARARSTSCTFRISRSRSTSQPSTTVHKHQVISSSPRPGAACSPGSTVVLVVSTGPPPRRRPDVVGETQGQARCCSRQDQVRRRQGDRAAFGQAGRDRARAVARSRARRRRAPPWT